MEKAYKYRLYPNAEQRRQIDKTIGACRFVWNHMLELRQAAWEVNGKMFSTAELMRHLTLLKKTSCGWLYEVSNPALQQVIRDQDKAYTNFYRRCKTGEAKKGFPKWRKKDGGRQSFRVPAVDGKYATVIDSKHVKLPKLGSVKCRVSRDIDGRIVNATVIREPSGKYYVSFCCASAQEFGMPLGQNEMLGIDAGIKDLMIRSDGVKVPNHRFLEKSLRKLRREQRRLSRRKKGSANWRKQKRRVALVYEKVSNQRKDAIHKATTQAVRESQAIAVESLNVSGMMRNHHIARAASDASMSEMIRQLQYKCDWYGRSFVKIDRWFPSSKTCCECGYVFDGLTLSMRKWTCPECGTYHDRDLNAARNISVEGKRLITLL